MIDRDYLRHVARYNRWQNRSLYREAEALGEEARRLPRGAFFGSIHATLSHLLWGDRVWMHRFAGLEKPPGGIRDSVTAFDDWAALRDSRAAFDAIIIAWADALDPAWLAGQLSWISGATQRTVSKPHWLLAAHMFNHQTHHRGQVHAMITMAGGKPDDTDLPFMPDDQMV
jgi:uncharacterized damage-inducible protein DinB